MKRGGEPHGGDVAQALGRLAQEGLRTPAPPFDEARAWRAVEAAAFRAPRARRSVWLAAGGLGVAAALAVTWAANVPLSYEVEGGVMDADGSFIEAPAASNARIKFSDGSAVALDAKGRGRVAERRKRGARILVERGRARVSVVPRPHAGWRWEVDAGPFVVHVTGTEFEVAWSPREEIFDLALHHGGVVVTHRTSARRWSLSAGERVRLLGSGHEHPLPVAAGPGEPTPVVQPVARRAAASSPASAQRRRLSPRAANAKVAIAPGTWPARVAAGGFADVFEEARVYGIGRLIGEGGLSELGALADAAAYTGRPDIAARAWRATRARFRGTVAAREATFLLGRHDEENGRPDEALRLFDVYLAEAPSGSFAAEALGRRMTLLERAGRTAEARAAAELYLRRHASGPYGRLAREISTR